jgi:hypothetical protein
VLLPSYFNVLHIYIHNHSALGHCKDYTLAPAKYYIKLISAAAAARHSQVRKATRRRASPSAPSASSSWPPLTARPRAPTPTPQIRPLQSRSLACHAPVFTPSGSGGLPRVIYP